MTLIRNKSLIKQVEIRDVGLCRCCGFKGSEAHHIIPICMSGEDNIKNIVLLCSLCHRDAPNTKQEFFEYMMRGGARIERMLGKIITFLEEKNMDFHKFFPLTKQIIKWARDVDKTNSLEEFNLKDSLEIEDVNFTEERNNYYQKLKINNLLTHYSPIYRSEKESHN